MLCFIYKSLKKDELYLYTNKKDDFSDLPVALLQSFGKPAFVMELELSAERTLARADTVKVLATLEEKGFFVQMPPTVLQASNRLH